MGLWLIRHGFGTVAGRDHVAGVAIGDPPSTVPEIGIGQVSRLQVKAADEAGTRCGADGVDRRRIPGQHDQHPQPALNPVYLKRVEHLGIHRRRCDDDGGLVGDHVLQRPDQLSYRHDRLGADQYPRMVEYRPAGGRIGDEIGGGIAHRDLSGSGGGKLTTKVGRVDQTMWGRGIPGVGIVACRPRSGIRGVAVCLRTGQIGRRRRVRGQLGNGPRGRVHQLGESLLAFVTIPQRAVPDHRDAGQAERDQPRYPPVHDSSVPHSGRRAAYAAVGMKVTPSQEAW